MRARDGNVTFCRMHTFACGSRLFGLNSVFAVLGGLKISNALMEVFLR